MSLTMGPCTSQRSIGAKPKDPHKFHKLCFGASVLVLLQGADCAFGAWVLVPLQVAAAASRLRALDAVCWCQYCMCLAMINVYAYAKNKGFVAL